MRLSLLSIFCVRKARNSYIHGQRK
uniref:Uncharacterized protein n=1 Tax=Arundo donax TaxID=35708 RepID=A0A0A9HS25_ARUDO